jgi:hypothetical protein
LGAIPSRSIIGGNSNGTNQDAVYFIREDGNIDDALAQRFTK